MRAASQLPIGTVAHARAVEASRASSSSVQVSLSYAEAVTLHEALAYGEWSGEFAQMSYRDPLFVSVLSRLQLSLAPLIPELGSERYGAAVDAALEQVRPAP
jgi:hypothetical protein